MVGILSSNIDDIKAAFSSLSTQNQWIIGVLASYTAFRLTIDAVLPLLAKPVRYVLRSRRNTPTDSKYAKDTLYLHMFPRSCTKQVPNLSPFAIKVETWLRLNKIPHKVVETNTFSSSTSQIPYLYHNGRELADSSFIIDYIEDVMNLDKSEGMTPEEEGTSRAFTAMVEESTAWTVFLHRYGFNMPEFSKIFQPALPKLGAYIFLKLFPNQVIKSTKTRGLGRKSKPQIYQIGNNDIKAISNFLDNKKFMMGDKMTKLDCAVFGQLSQIVYVDFHYPHMDCIKENCSNLLPYMDRIKTACWPDWDEIVHKGHFF